ncbi:MAG: hypothetical protein KatS3mg111_2005 [Pirellulaceae bacterium]|nr:MAG: hypothetical protein KatS3mg111_2005 [Pirellulaceae bacterium]
MVEASVDTSWFGVDQGYARFNTVLANRATPAQPFDLSFQASLESFDTGMVEIPLGDYFTIFGRAQVNTDAAANEPYFILRQAGVRVEEAAPDSIKGLTFEAGGFGISADLQRVFVMAAEPVDDPATLDFDETIGAFFRVAIDEDSGVPGGNVFGLPDWFPLHVTEVGIRFKGAEGTGDDFDLTLDQLGSDSLTPFQELVDPRNYRLIVSGGLESSEGGWPIRAQIKKLEIKLAELARYVSNSCATHPALIGSETCPLPFDVSSVNGVSIGMEPFELGPVSIGGGLTLGVQDVQLDNSEHRQVLYAQVQGELSAGNVGIGAELVITQYGPVLVRLKSGVPIPIGGIVGAGVGAAFFGIGAAAGYQIGNQTGFVIEGLEGALVFDAPPIEEVANPIDILARPEFARPKNLSPSEIEAAITRIVNKNQYEPTFTWNKGFRLVVSGVLTNTNLYNAIGGRVTVGMNVGYDAATLEALSQSKAQVFVRGDVEILGQSLAQADIVFDSSDPINPSINVAAGIPGTGGLLSLLLPMQARIGAQFDTDGLAAGTAIAARAFLETIANESNTYLDQALGLVARRYENERLAYIGKLAILEAEVARLERLKALNGNSSVFDSLITAAQQAVDRERQRPAFFKFLLDLNENRQLDEGGPGDELGSASETLIDTAFLKNRMLGGSQVPAAIPSIADLLTPGSIDSETFQLGVMAAGKLLTDLMQVAPELDVDWDPQLFTTGIPQLDQLIQRLFVAGVERATALADTHFTQLVSLVDSIEPDSSGLSLADSLIESRTRMEKSARMAGAIASVIFSTLGSAAEEATNAFFDVMNPSFSIEGYVQPVILGFPIGPPRERVHVRIDKTRIDIDAQVRLIEQLMRIATQGTLPVSPMSDITNVNVHVPFTNLFKDLFLNRIPEIDFSGPSPWFAGLGGTVDLYGLELAQVQGLMFPGDVVLEDNTATTGARYLKETEHLLVTDPGQLGSGKIYVDPQLPDDSGRTNWDKIQGGGILLDGRLTLPRFLTEPVDLFNEVKNDLLAHMQGLGQQCDDTISCVIAHPDETFAFLRFLTEVPGAITAQQQVAQLQLFVPDLLTPVVEELGGLDELVGLPPAELVARLTGRAAELGDQLSEKWATDGYLFGQYGSVESVPGNPDATTGKLLGVDLGEALVIGRGEQLEIIGDFLGLETRFLVDLNSSAAEQYEEINGTPGFNLAEPFAPEPFEDTNGDGQWQPGEPLEDWNGNGTWDALGGDFDGDGLWDPGEVWNDKNGNGVVDAAEPFEDLNKNGRWDSGDPWSDLNRNGVAEYWEYEDTNPRNGQIDLPEPWTDLNGDGVYTEQEWVDLNKNGRFDPQGEVFIDLNNDGVRQAVGDRVLPTAGDDGDEQLDGGLPRVAAEVILGNAPAACAAFGLPNVHTVVNATAQFNRFLTAIGVGGLMGIDPNNPEATPGWLQLRTGTDNGGCMRVYSPGYSYDETDPLIMRRGGAELLADIDIPGLITDGSFTFNISLPESGLIPDFSATGTADAISGAAFFLPGTGAEGVQLTLRRETAPGGGSTVTMGLGASVNLLGLTFEMPYRETTLGNPGSEEASFQFGADDTGGFGNMQLIAPSDNNPLADGSWPVKIDGGTLSLLFDTRPATAGMSIELSDATLIIPGFSLEHASASIRVDADGALHFSNIRGDSNLLGAFGVSFNGGFTVVPPDLSGLPTVTNVTLSAEVHIDAVPNVPAVLEAHGDLSFAFDGTQATGSFTGWGFLAGVPAGDSTNPAMSGSLDAGGCLQVQFGALQGTFNLPGGNCGVAEGQVRLDLGPSAELVDGTPLAGPEVVIHEGDNGTTRIRIPVTLQALAAADQPTTVRVSFDVTADTAQPGSDYNVVTTGPIDFSVDSSQMTDTKYIEIDIVADANLFEALNEQFHIAITVDSFSPPAGSDTSLFQGVTAMSVTLQNDDPPDPNDYPAGLWTAPYGALAHWTFDDPQPGSLDYTPLGQDLRNSMDPAPVDHFGKLVVSKRGLPGLVEEDGLFWLGGSNALGIAVPPRAEASWDFTVQPSSLILNYDPTEFRFYTRTTSRQPDWRLQWSLDGTTFHEITTSGQSTPALSYHDWDRYEIALPGEFEANDMTLPVLAQPITFRIATTDPNMQIDSVSVLGKKNGALDEFLFDLNRFLERMDQRLPHDLDITGAGKVQVGIGPEVVSPGGTPEPAVVIELFDTMPDDTYITLLSGNGYGTGQSLPVVVRSHGGIESIDLSTVTHFEGVLDVDGDVTGSVLTTGIDRGRIDIQNSASSPVTILAFGNFGTAPGADGVSISADQRIGNLQIAGSWLSGELRAKSLGSGLIQGEFRGGVSLRNGFDNLTFANGDFAPTHFQVGTANRPGSGDSGQLSVTNGDLTGTLNVLGTVDVITVSAGTMNADLTATHINTVTATTHATLLLGGDVNGNLQAGSIDAIQITGGDLNAGIELTDAQFRDVDIAVSEYCYAGQCKGGRINSPGSIHVAGGVKSIVANDVFMGLHVEGPVESIVVVPYTDGRRSGLRGQFDAGRFGSIQVTGATVDVQLTAKDERWRMGKSPGIELIELIDSTWTNGMISLPDGVPMGTILDDGNVLEWPGDVNTIMAGGYRLEQIPGNWGTRAVVIPASWQNPVNRLDVNQDSYVTPLDVLLVINAINRNGSRPLPRPSLLGSLPAPFYDTTGDDYLQPLDALLIINHLNRRVGGEAEFTAEFAGPSSADQAQAWSGAGLGPWESHDSAIPRWRERILPLAAPRQHQNVQRTPTNTQDGRDVLFSRLPSHHARHVDANRIVAVDVVALDTVLADSREEDDLESILDLLTSDADSSYKP